MHLLIFSANQLAGFWSPESAKIVLITMGGWIPIDSWTVDIITAFGNLLCDTPESYRTRWPLSQ
jgi:hypothetical protein